VLDWQEEVEEGREVEEQGQQGQEQEQEKEAEPISVMRSTSIVSMTSLRGPRDAEISYQAAGAAGVAEKRAKTEVALYGEQEEESEDEERGSGY
jgi:hypothetical protein